MECKDRSRARVRKRPGRLVALAGFHRYERFLRMSERAVFSATSALASLSLWPCEGCVGDELDLSAGSEGPGEAAAASLPRDGAIASEP